MYNYLVLSSKFCQLVLIVQMKLPQDFVLLVYFLNLDLDVNKVLYISFDVLVNESSQILNKLYDYQLK